MKKITWLVATLLLINTHVHACDICGCAFGSSYMGILPQFNKNFVGVRWQQRNFTSRHFPTLLEPVNNKVSKDIAQVMDIWGRLYISDRVMAFYSLPYVVNTKIEDHQTTRYNGLADALIGANFIVYNSGDSIRKKTRQTLMLGGGIKLPTGRFRQDAYHVNIQTGTGSVDLISNISYTLRYKELGVSADAMYKYNTTNQYNHRYGNQIFSSTRLFYWHKIKMLSIMPFATVMLEHQQKDLVNRRTDFYTGALGTYAGGGIEIYGYRWSVGVQAVNPIYQQYSEGMVRARERFSAFWIVLF
jgi:hypothetical protein